MAWPGAGSRAPAWSPAKHLFHILRSNGMMLKGIHLICQGHRMTTHEGAPNDAGRRCNPCAIYSNTRSRSKIRRNRLYYGALLRARAARSDAGFRAVFLHLPSLPECVAEAGEVRASMPLATSRRAVDAVLDYLARLPG